MIFPIFWRELKLKNSSEASKLMYHMMSTFLVDHLPFIIRKSLSHILLVFSHWHLQNVNKKKKTLRNIVNTWLGIYTNSDVQSITIYFKF